MVCWWWLSSCSWKKTSAGSAKMLPDPQSIRLLVLVEWWANFKPFQIFTCQINIVSKKIGKHTHKNSRVCSPYHYPAADSKAWIILSTSFTSQSIIFKISKQFVFERDLHHFVRNYPMERQKSVGPQTLTMQILRMIRSLFDEIH